MATIEENLSRIQSAKTDIKTAIEAKGVTVPSSATIDTYSTYVSQISGGGGGIPMPSNLSAATLNNFGLLTSAAIKNGVTSIGYRTFYYCTSLTSIDISDSVTSIANDAFYNCKSLTSVTIPNSVTSIGSGAFNLCNSLTSIIIPDSVTSIDSRAFNNCRSLTSVTVNALTPPKLGGSVFNNTNECPIYVPAQSVDAYKSATEWSTYASRIQAIPT